MRVGVATFDARKFLTPEIIKSNLVLSSLYLTAYEILKSAIIDRIRDIFTFDDVDGNPIVDDQYRKVSSVHRDLLHASCLWLEQNAVLTGNEIQEIASIRRHRNQIAHELPRLLSERDLDVNLEYFENPRTASQDRNLVDTKLRNADPRRVRSH